MLLNYYKDVDIPYNILTLMHTTLRMDIPINNWLVLLSAIQLTTMILFWAFFLWRLCSVGFISNKTADYSVFIFLSLWYEFIYKVQLALSSEVKMVMQFKSWKMFIFFVRCYTWQLDIILIGILLVWTITRKVGGWSRKFVLENPECRNYTPRGK